VLYDRCDNFIESTDGQSSPLGVLIDEGFEDGGNAASQSNK